MHTELPVNEGFWHEYWSILSDPAHALAELTFTMIDILILSPLIMFLWLAMKRWFNKRIQDEHSVLDAEHGYEHDEDDSPKSR